MRCVVTGAMGFVGLNVVRRLAESGHTVIAVGRQEPDDWVLRFLDGVERQVEFRRADLAVGGALQTALTGDTFDTVIHAAVITATTEAVEREAALEIVAVNVGGTMEALDVAKRANVRRFVYVSSPAAIGDVPYDGPLNEDTVTRPVSIYGITKQASEQLVQRYGAIHGVSTVSVRIAQPYGPGERATASRVRTSPIWEWVVAASRDERLVTGPLSTGRDWTYIGDTARGIATLAEAAALRHGLYHLNFGDVVLVGDVVVRLRGAYPRLQIDDRSEAEGLNPNIAGRNRRWPLDNRRFRDEFGWVPETGLADGMERYLEWWRGWEM